MVLVNIYIWYAGKKKYGVVKDEYGNPIEGALIGLRELEFDTLSSKRVTDEKGHYRFLVDGGNYRLEALNQNDYLTPSEKLSFYTDKNEVMVIKPNLILKRSHR